MKKAIVMLAIIACTIALATPSFAAWSVTASRHNFGNTNTWGTVSTASTPNVCVFCHTPHAARNYSTVNAPLWNRQTAKDVNSGGALTYSMYTSPTLDSQTSTMPDGVSLACLSCHDGTVALDALVNAPGSGNWTNPATTSQISQGWTFTRSSGIDANDGANSVTITTADMREIANALETGSSATRWIPFLGSNGGGGNHTANRVDLRDDHPISMNYAGTVGNISPADPKFNAAAITKSGWAAVVLGTNTTSQTTVTDGDIRLFANGDTNYKVQCASCHNPHGTVDGSSTNRAYPTFLQQPMTGSKLCLICHIK